MVRDGRGGDVRAGGELDGEEGGGGRGDAEGAEGLRYLFGWGSASGLGWKSVEMGRERREKRGGGKEEERTTHVVVRPETEHDLAVHIPTLQPPVPGVVGRSENRGQHVRRRHDLNPPTKPYQYETFFSPHPSERP